MNSSSYNYNVTTSLFIIDPVNIATAKNVIVLALGLIINYINSTLIHTFRKHQIFIMNPRYILFIHLVVNDMIQLTMSVSMFVMSYIFFSINAFLCCLMVTFAIFTTLNTPLNLAVMAVECYIAVCFPLRHAEICTIKRTYILIGCIWALSSVSVIPEFLFLLATEPLWLFYSKTYCGGSPLYRHPASLLKRDITYMICLSGVWLTIFCTYFKIFFAARAANSADGKEKKARNTILLHGFQVMLCMLTYVDPVVTRSIMASVPNHFLQIHFVWYIVVHILPRLISPIVYGLRDKTFKQYLKKYYVLCSIRPNNKLFPSVKLRLFF
ncbi:odorant receptor 131-2-like [Kryptolebias marmoratus]|uniref:odorant receptor 131-2-like n=1 Tax=Kryptolebias marmoratus TaxID=37003 RepID=UPI0007F8E4B9|nr:odorant receptor 131-2-like [Kryptolebias marmoratus]